MGMPKVCIFCGGKPLTKEHIWPKWLRPYIPHQLTDHTASSSIIATDRIEETRRKWSGDPRNRSVRVVCARCNSGWMSRLQEQSKDYLLPLVSGTACTLGKNRQTALATWCAMSAMTAEFLGDGRRQAISPADRNHLQSKLRPPSPLYWRIWIAHYVRRDWVGQWVQMMSRVASDGDKVVDSDGIAVPNTQTTTLVVGQLYIHLFSCPHDEIVRRVEPTETAKSLFTQIWPVDQRIVRWPTTTITDENADHFALAIMQALDNVHRQATGMPPAAARIFTKP